MPFTVVAIQKESKPSQIEDNAVLCLTSLLAYPKWEMPITLGLQRNFSIQVKYTLHSVAFT